jgi:hypothetical protein
MTTTIRFSENGLAFATYANVGVVVIRQPLSIAKVRRLRQEVEQLHQQFGHARTMLTIVESAAVASPDNELRSEFAAIARELPAAQNVIVLEGSGFRMAAARAIMNAMALLSGNASKQHTFVSVEPALEAIVEHGRVPGLTHEDLAAVVTTARAAK